MSSPREKYIVRMPVYEVGRNVPVTGRQFPTMTYINDKLAPGSNVYVEFSWIWDVPDPNPLFQEHSHDYDQVALHIGSDYKNPESLGAELDMVIEGRKITTDTTHALYLPKGTRHGPFTWKKVEKPLIEMTIVMGAGKVENLNLGGLK